MDEQMLRRALMEASLERFRDVLEGADRDWNWSPRYLRSRTRLLADPFGWAKRMARPVWKRAVRAAACAALPGAGAALPRASSCTGLGRRIGSE